MNYVENIYICLAAPMIVAAILLNSEKRKLLLFFIAGMTTCLLSSYVSTFLALCYGADRLNASLELAPTVEEVMKLFPILFYLLVFNAKKEEAVESALIIGIGFATFENVNYLMMNDASNVLHLIIRGFGTGTMHVVTGVVIAIGLNFLWDRPFIKVVGTLVLLCTASIYHATFNILVSQTGGVAVIGYCIPVVTAILAVILKKKLKSLL
jgi:RsiW-degrading membrane proteinase PrsW (M82 family)